MKKKKVLIVEGYEMLFAMWRAALLDTSISIVSAATLEEARWEFGVNKGELDAIVICGFVGGGSQPTKGPNTLELAVEFRKEFKGLMVASSSDPDIREALLKAGCDHECTDKTNLSRRLKEILEV